MAYDEYGMSKKKKNERYGMGDMGVMGQDKKPYKCDAFAAQKHDMGRVKRIPMEMRGNPKQAYKYNY